MIDIIDIFAVGLIMSIPVAIFVVFILPKIEKNIPIIHHNWLKVPKGKKWDIILGFSCIIIVVILLCFINKTGGGFFPSPKK